MKVFTITMMAALFTLVGCSSKKHITQDYEEHARFHRTIAVLPYDITIKGKEARELTVEQMDELIISESEIFQQSLYSELLKRTGRREKDIKISIQDTRTTNRLLLEADIDGLNIREYSANQLGDILNVDAVVSTRLIKEGFLSREGALAADIISNTILVNTPIGYSNRQKLSRSSKVDIYCYILDVDSDVAVWQYNTECDLRWDMEPDETIEFINGKISKKFPYRN